MINELDTNTLAISLRNKFGQNNDSPIDIFNVLANVSNITIIYRSMDQNISGMCKKTDKSSVIVINSETSYGRQRYTAAHELCHIYFDNFDEYICDKNLDTNSSETERRADLFASYFLAPDVSFKSKTSEFLKETDSKQKLCTKLEQYFQMSHLAVLVRLKRDRVISLKEFDEISKEKPSVLASSMGYETDLYHSRNEKKNFTTGRYISLVKDLYDKQIINQARYEEILIDAYRQDLVFGESDASIDND
jgi:Zn-dependent peptidase ImmA (M78 family)